MEYGCIGERLGHSFSKEIHAKLFDYCYELKEISRDELQEFMLKKNFKAINVTIPYKQAVIKYLDEIDDVAYSIGAVNTVINKNGKLIGYNTDFLGMNALIEQSGIVVADKKVLILGSGGTSKTAMTVVNKLGATEVIRVSRKGSDACITYEQALSMHSDADILINTTPCGMYPDIGKAVVDISLFYNLSGVVDAVYNPLKSKLVCDALKCGIKAVGGLYMLVAQAAFAAEKFTGISVKKEKINEIYRKTIIKKQNIVLIGMPGCGKSIVGRILAERLGMHFIDTDEEIVKKEGCTITDIFSKVGECGFRNIESEIISEVSALQSSVISTGGGAVLRDINIELLRENGMIYFIDRDLNKLAVTSDRPLSSNITDLKKRYDERYDIYCRSADKIIKSENSAVDNANIIEKDFLYEYTCY